MRREKHAAFEDRIATDRSTPELCAVRMCIVEIEQVLEMDQWRDSGSRRVPPIRGSVRGMAGNDVKKRICAA